MPGACLNIPGWILDGSCMDPKSTIDGHILEYFGHKHILDSLDDPGNT